MKATSYPVKSAEEARDRLDLSAVHYSDIKHPYTGSISDHESDTEEEKTQKSYRRCHRNLKKLTQVCNYDDKLEHILYVDEWVRNRKYSSHNTTGSHILIRRTRSVCAQYVTIRRRATNATWRSRRSTTSKKDFSKQVRRNASQICCKEADTETANSETDYDLSDFAEKLREKYDVVITFLEPTKDVE